MDCPDCEGEKVISYTYAEARIDPGGSNDHAANKAGEIAGYDDCETCGGTGDIDTCLGCEDGTPQWPDGLCKVCRKQAEEQLSAANI